MHSLGGGARRSWWESGEKCWSGPFIFGYLYIITNASKCSHLFWSLKSKGEKSSYSLRFITVFFSVLKFENYCSPFTIKIGHLVLSPGPSRVPSELRFESWPMPMTSLSQLPFLSPNRFSLWAELEIVVLKLCSGSLSSSKPLKMQVSHRLSFLSLPLSSGILIVPMVSIFMVTQVIPKSTSPSLPSSQSPGPCLQLHKEHFHVADHHAPEMDKLLSQCSGAASVPGGGEWGHRGLKSQASCPLAFTSLFLLLQNFSLSFHQVFSCSSFRSALTSVSRYTPSLPPLKRLHPPSSLPRS